MQWLIIVGVCLLTGWWLFTMLLGGAGEAQEAVSSNPARGFLGIVFFAIVAAIGFMIIGLLAGN